MAPNLWPWLAVAAMGALHGMNPAAGWVLGAWRARSHDKVQLRRLLLPIAAGQGAAVITVAAAVPAALRLGLEFDPLWLQGVAAGLLLALMLHRVVRDGRDAARPRAAHAGVALWSFIVGTAHGAGWMLVPALVPLCASDMPARELTASGSLWLALAAVGVHMAAMLATTAAMAAIAARGIRAARREPRRRPPLEKGRLRQELTE